MYRRWTTEEMELLEDKWGVWGVKRLAKNLNRTETAIIEKAEKMKLGGAYEQYLTTNQIGQMFGIHRQTVYRSWIKKYGLPAKKSALRRQTIYRIILEDLVEWCYNNQELWSSKNLELYSLGEEFEWLVEKRKIDAQITTNTGFWSTKEIQNLIDWSEAGVPLQEIAKRLNRTYYAVRRKRQGYLDSLKEKRAV